MRISAHLLPVLTAVAVLYGPAIASAQEQATPEEVIAKVKEAVEYLSTVGDAGLDQFQSKDSAFVWKDTYVVVNDCAKKALAAHPVRPELAGASFADAPGFGGLTGAQVGDMLCAAGEQPQGGWVEYMFPKPGEQEPSRKLSYAKAVAGTPYVLIAGIYDEDAKVADLEKMIGE
jgi:signal transduction histidine kinase